MSVNFMATSLSEEFKYYLDHQDEMVKKYWDKVVVIKNQEVLGVYSGEL